MGRDKDSSMSEPNRTVLRHRILREIADYKGTVFLDCVNAKQGIWKPRRENPNGDQFNGDQFGNFSSSEDRAVNDLLFTYVDTPHWQGDMDVYRQVEITEVGRKLLARWDAEVSDV